ncbi:HAD hydrolase family protein [Candidatus Woesearchaeota archaeon]|nr:HAD hydrolase family protein [Candidatus Woesearchaeota archaeon]
MKNTIISLDDIDAIIFDFDGVLTNNLVHFDQDGKEWVTCSRSDGIAFDCLRRIKKPVYILSTEENLVVTARANKLKVPVQQGVKNKFNNVKKLAKQKGFEIRRLMYVGNDLNDYRAMQLCGYAVCPSDSHKLIKETAMITLKTPGGKGVVRELLEDVFKLDLIRILYKEE